MTEIPATWPRTLAIWLAYFWRHALLYGIALLVLVLPFKIAVAQIASNLTPAELAVLMNAGKVLVSLISAPIALRLTLATSFAGFQIALVESAASASDSTAETSAPVAAGGKS